MFILFLINPSHYFSGVMIIYRLFTYQPSIYSLLLQVCLCFVANHTCVRTQYRVLAQTSTSSLSNKTIQKLDHVPHQEHVPYRQGPQGQSLWIQQFLRYAQTIPNHTARQAVQKVLQNPKTYRFQLLITEVNHIHSAHPQFTTHEFRVDQEYFYPASAIKTYASLSALIEYTRAQKKYPWLSLNDAIGDSASHCQRSDPSNQYTHDATLQHEIKKMQLVSDNHAFNRIFLLQGGRDTLHKNLIPYFPSLRIYHRLFTHQNHQATHAQFTFLICDRDAQGRINNRKSFIRSIHVHSNKDALSHFLHHPLYSQTTPLPYSGFGPHATSVHVGQGYYSTQGRKYIPHPMDFSVKNRSSFYDLQRLMLALYYNGRFDPITPHPRSHLRNLFKQINPHWLNTLRQAMVMYPRKSTNPTYKKRSFTETRFKPLLKGLRTVISPSKHSIYDHSLYYMNKAGKAFGFHVDNALIIIGKNAGKKTRNGKLSSQAHVQKGLFITVGVYANHNQILNDNQYEYKSVSIPFLEAMGYAVGYSLLHVNHK